MGFFLGLLHLDVMSVQQGLHIVIEELLLGLGLGLLSNLNLIGVCLESPGLSSSTFLLIFSNLYLIEVCPPSTSWCIF